jgi:hypothetical protein
MYLQALLFIAKIMFGFFCIDASSAVLSARKLKFGLPGQLNQFGASHTQNFNIQALYRGYPSKIIGTIFGAVF